MDEAGLETAVLAAFHKYLHFDGAARRKTPFTPFRRSVGAAADQAVYYGNGADGRSCHRPVRRAGENGIVRASNALRARLSSNERETEDRDYVERCFGRSLYPPRQLALIEQRTCRQSSGLPPLVYQRGTGAGKPVAPTPSGF